MEKRALDIKTWDEMTTGEKTLWCIKFPFAMVGVVIYLLPLAWFYLVGNRIDERKQMTFWALGVFIDKDQLIKGLFMIRPTGWWFFTPKKVKIMAPENFQGKILPYTSFRHMQNVWGGNDDYKPGPRELTDEEFAEMLKKQAALRIGPAGNLTPITMDVEFPEGLPKY